ncbi:MAG: class I SAM-dependent RNA methyltransferase [Acidobacteria bacterium]|nr:class I SAM-dependent RNA methyltransferase [Acidobacteriota bacterium]
MTFEIAPQKLIYGGDALGYRDGRAVFVPRVLPRERVEAEVVRVAKGIVHARPLRILEPSPDRIEPPCPYFGHCGGCHYQHFGPQRQAEVKQEILRETLRRTGKINWEKSIVLHTAQPQNYRNQAQFKVGRTPEGLLEIGFFEAYSHRVFPVESCLLLSDKLNQVLREFRRERWASLLEGCTEIELFADQCDDHTAVILRGMLTKGESVANEILSSIPGVASVAVEAGSGLQVVGEPHLTYSVGEFGYRVRPGSFFQVSRFLLPKLVDAVIGPVHGESALDLFAGVGLFTLPMARSFGTVIGVEASRSAAADLAANAKAHAFTNVRTVEAGAQDFLRRFAQVGVDLVVLDPPRAGVGASVLKLLVGVQPKRIHYVSCSPPTLARDLGFLVAHGYEPESVEMFDFFPHTYHLEALVRLVRRAV